MKIDTGAIEGYSEMTTEQKLAALEAFEYEDYSSENERLKTAVSKANSEAAGWKKKHNALLDEDGKKRQEAEEANKKIIEELETLRKDKKISDFTARYLKLGYDSDLAAATAKAMADGDMEAVFKNGEAHRAALEKRIKAELMNRTPKPDGSGGEGKQDDSDVAKARELAKARSGGDNAYKTILDSYK